MKDEDIGKMSEDVILAIRENVRTSAYQCAIMAFLDVVDSKEVLASVRPYARLSAEAFIINITKVFGIDSVDLDKIGDICFIWTRVFDFDMKEIERTNSKIVYVGGTNCHWRDNPKEGCIMMHEMVFNETCQAINPNYACRFTQMITKGDPICSWIIEKKTK